MTAPTVFEEASAAPKITAVPMSHLSIELGHLYVEDLRAGIDRLRLLAKRVAPWAATATAESAAMATSKSARVSTCVLIDDYFAELDPPSQVLPMLQEAMRDAGLTIDYLCRESACAHTGDLPLAELVADRLVPEPPSGSNGGRPVVHESGWLCNGVRSPEPAAEAMSRRVQWSPPTVNAPSQHAVFIDVELWHDRGPARVYSCSFLAAVWQLLRLGIPRHLGRPVATPQPLPDVLPGTWAELPAVTRLSERPPPFAAYRTFSVLDGRYLGVEHAVRTILSHVDVDATVAAQIADRATHEGVELPAELVERVGYTFVAGSR